MYGRKLLPNEMYQRNLLPNWMYQRNLLPNNSIVDWVTIERVRIERFFSEVVTIEKEKMHQKMNYAFNQNLFCCNCISFENFFHAICQCISMYVGFTNKSGASQGFEKFNLLKWVSDSVAPEGEDKLQNSFASRWVTESHHVRWWSGKCDWHINSLFDYLQRSNSYEHNESV